MIVEICNYRLTSIVISWCGYGEPVSLNFIPEFAVSGAESWLGTNRVVDVVPTTINHPTPVPNIVQPDFHRVCHFLDVPERPPSSLSCFAQDYLRRPIITQFERIPSTQHSFPPSQIYKTRRHDSIPRLRPSLARSSRVCDRTHRYLRGIHHRSTISNETTFLSSMKIDRGDFTPLN